MSSQVTMSVLANGTGKETGSCHSCFQLASEDPKAALELKQVGLTVVDALGKQERSTEAQSGPQRN